MATASKRNTNLVAQNPLIVRCHRLMEAFAKSDDERDFYLDRVEGFMVYVDLDKPHEDLLVLEKALKADSERYVMIPKLTFYETKKIMEGFVNEKVYDIDTKEKLLEIIQSKSARENFLEFIYDHHSELEKWQQYYQERSRIRIIEWLRKNHFQFVFEEDLDLSRALLEKLKTSLFEKKVARDLQVARKALETKAKIYYSNEALNPRPKRGRPPKQAAKLEIEPQVSTDIYTTVPSGVRPFLFVPDITHASSVTFSSKFGTEEDLLASRKQSHNVDLDLSLENLNKKLASLREISSRLAENGVVHPIKTTKVLSVETLDANDGEEGDEETDWEDEEENMVVKKKRAKVASKSKPKAAKRVVKARGLATAKRAVVKKAVKKAVVKKAVKKAVVKRAVKKAVVKAVVKKAVKKAVVKKAVKKVVAKKSRSAVKRAW